jgi:hypothetical protein
MNDLMKNILAGILLATAIGGMAIVDRVFDLTAQEKVVECRYEDRASDFAPQAVRECRIYSTNLIR